MIFGIKEKYNFNFDPCNVLLAIATNVPVLLKTGFVLQGHIYIYFLFEDTWSKKKYIIQILMNKNTFNSTYIL